MKKGKMSGTMFPTWNRYSVPHDRNLSPSVEVTQQRVTSGSLGHGQKKKKNTEPGAAHHEQLRVKQSIVLFCLCYLHKLMFTTVTAWCMHLLALVFFCFFWEKAFISCTHLEQIFASLDWEILPAVPMLRCWFNVMAVWFGSSYRLLAGFRWDYEIKSDEA